MPQVAKHDIFLSYSSKDRYFARQLADDLKREGFDVWVDYKDLNAGDSLADAIQEALASSRLLIIVMSPDYFTSAWTQREWQYALSKELYKNDVRLIPLLYRDCQVPAPLLEKQWADFRDAELYGQAFKRLTVDLRALLSGQKAPEKGTETPKPGERIQPLGVDALSELKIALEEAVRTFRSQPEPPPRPAAADGAERQNVDERLCFIMMPFGVESLGVVYEDFVKPTLDQCGLRAERGDDVFGSNVIMDDITKSIKRAGLIIADLTGRNPNVFYEIGIAHALNKQVLLMTQSIDDVPFDLRHRRALMYEYSPRGCKKLEKDLYENVQSMLLSRNNNP